MMGKIKRTDIWQFLRFCVVGISNTAIDFAVLNLLLWLYPTTNAWEILGYNSAAVLLGSTNSFFWNKYWTFRRRNPVTSQEVYRFLVIAGATTLMSDALLSLLNGAFPGVLRGSLLGANILKLGAIIGTLFVSFFGMRLWVFFQKRLAAEDRLQADYETEKRPVFETLTPVNALSSIPLSRWSNKQTQTRNLRPVKLLPLHEIESALEPLKGRSRNMT